MTRSTHEPDSRICSACSLGVPGWIVGAFVLLAASPSVHGAGRICIGGTSARRSGSAKDLGKYLLADDNQWHSITLDARVIRKIFPDVRYLQSFQFYTQGNGRKGHEFWIDDFAITAMPASTSTPKNDRHR